MSRKRGTYQKSATKSGKIALADCIKSGRDSKFFAAKEASLSAEGGDSPREQEKSRISVFKQYAIVQSRKRAG